MSDPLIIRISDRAIFEALFPGVYACAEALKGIGNGSICYGLRRVVWVPYKWWFGGRLVRTGEIWEPECSCEYDEVARHLVVAGCKMLEERKP